MIVIENGEPAVALANNPFDDVREDTHELGSWIVERLKVCGGRPAGRHRHQEYEGDQNTANQKSEVTHARGDAISVGQQRM